MLTTDDILNLNDPQLELSNANNNIDQNEDFIQQLSKELDIPMLLDPNNSILNFGNCEDDLLSEVMSADSTWSQYDTLNNFDNFGFDCLDSADLLSLKTDIKLEPCVPSSPESLYDSINSHSPTPSQSSDGSTNGSIETKNDSSIGFDTPPVSPQEKTKLTPINQINLNSTNNRSVAISNLQRKTPNNKSNNNNKLIINSPTVKRIPIQPKLQYSVSPAKNKRKIVPSENLIIKNELDPVGIKSPQIISSINSTSICNSANKVVVLENVPVQTPQVVNLSSVQLQSMPVIYTDDSQSNLTLTIPSDIDAKALKRQQRMIKNRESACLSRKKKKDYLMSLEKELTDLKIENQKLKQENAQLRERLFGKNKGVTITLPNKINKSATFLLAILFMVSINVGSIRGLFNLNQQNSFDTDINLNIENTHHGRNLLWTPEQLDQIPTNISNEHPMCPMTYVNESESVRLAQELHRWIAKPYNLSIEVKSKQTRRKLDETQVRIPLYQRMGGRKAWRKSLTSNSAGSDNQIQVFKPRPETMYSEFFEAINRQDDTFYIVSFNADNMLLPALHHNNTRRPKMSLLLPAMLPNESFSDNNTMISLMQIDCEVVDTRLLHVKSRSIPQHLRTPAANYTRNGNNDDGVNETSTARTSHNSSQNGPDNSKLYKPYFLRNASFKSNIDRLYSEKAKKVFKYN